MTSDAPRHGETNYNDNPELYELKIQLMEHVLGMSCAQATWRHDLIEHVKGMQRELSELRRLRESLSVTLGNLTPRKFLYPQRREPAPPSGAAAPGDQG